MTNEQITTAVAAEVRAEVARKQVSQQTIADALGVSRQSLQRRLSGETPFDVAELAAIARVLGVPVTHFLPAPEPAGGAR